MRVAIDCTPLLGAGTGVATFTVGAVSALAARSDVSLAGYVLSGRRAISLPEGVSHGRKVPAAWALRAWSMGIRWPAAEWLGRGPIDAVHGTNFVVPPASTAGRVVTVHDLAAVTFPQMCTPTARRYPALIRRAIDEGAWVHTPSEFVAAEVCELLGAQESRVRAVAHGVDRSVGDRDLGRRLAGAERYVLALGTVEPRKDLPALVRAWDRVAEGRPSVRLVIAGPDGWGSSELAKALGGARHRERVVRIGWVEIAQRQALLAGAAVFAFPSVYEGFGLPPLEAMAAGVPVVATAAGAVPEIVGAAALLVPVGDEAALADALASVLDDAAIASSLVVAGLARSASYSWEACAEELVALYRAASDGSA